MSTLSIILLVLLTMDLFVWALALVGAIGGSDRAQGWFAWIACVLLGLSIYLH